MVISSRKSENFELFCPLGAMKLGVKKCVCLCVGVYFPFWLKFGMVPSIYGALMLLNFYGNQRRGLGAENKLLGVSN